MKNQRLLSFLLLTFLFYAPTFGQISKGTITIQGQAGFGYQWAGSESPEGLYLNWSPGFGLMLTDGLMIGGVIGGSTSSADDIGTDAIIQPFIRYYFNPASSQNLYFAGGSIGIPVGSDFPLAGSVLAGVNRFITPNLALEGTIGYTLFELDDNQISAGLGLRVFLNREGIDDGENSAITPATGSLLVGSNNFRLGFTNNTFQFNLAPNLGYFLTKKIVLGGNLDFAFLNGGTSTRNFNSFSFQLQPFGRYYFLQSNRCHWFGELGGGIRYAKTTQEDLWDYRSNNFNVYGKAGVNLFVAPSVAFEFSVGLTHNFDANVNAQWNQDVIPLEDVIGRTDSQTTLLAFNVGLQFFIFKPE